MIAHSSGSSFLLPNNRLLRDTCPALRAYARAPKPER